MNIGKGTPQDLCLEMHQSGLPSTIDNSLSLPFDGKKLVSLIALIAFFLKEFFSIEINHCGVAL